MIKLSLYILLLVIILVYAYAKPVTKESSRRGLRRTTTRESLQDLTKNSPTIDSVSNVGHSRDEAIGDETGSSLLIGEPSHNRMLVETLPSRWLAAIDPQTDKRRIYQRRARGERLQHFAYPGEEEEQFVMTQDKQDILLGIARHVFDPENAPRRPSVHQRTEPKIFKARRPAWNAKEEAALSNTRPTEKQRQIMMDVKERVRKVVNGEMESTYNGVKETVPATPSIDGIDEDEVEWYQMLKTWVRKWKKRITGGGEDGWRQRLREYWVRMKRWLLRRHNQDN